jgi:uncharacterized cofD-like protein
MKRIVVVGGGTGLSTLLRGLKEIHNFRLTAVVTITDEGGSSGTIREEMNIPPPGDVRNNIVALAEDENLLTRLIRYRFTDSGTFEGHSVGNIVLAALTKILGSFPEAVKKLSDVLAIQGTVYPVSAQIVRLIAVNEYGKTLVGEKEIQENNGKIIYLSTNIPFSAIPEVLLALKEADGIIFGPGSLYTSIIPNVLAEGFSEAVTSNPCKKIYISNIMTQPGETVGYSVSDHVREIEKYLRVPIDELVANSQEIPEQLKERYNEQKAVQVKIDIDGSQKRIVLEPMIKTVVDERDQLVKVRHDERKLASIIRRILT